MVVKRYFVALKLFELQKLFVVIIFVTLSLLIEECIFNLIGKFEEWLRLLLVVSNGSFTVSGLKSAFISCLELMRSLGFLQSITLVRLYKKGEKWLVYIMRNNT